MSLKLVLVSALFIAATFAAPGANVNCSTGATCVVTDCTAVTGYAWQLNGNMCQIVNCPASTYPTTGLTDQFCTSCPPSGVTTPTFANSTGAACVAASATCASTRTAKWTKADCGLCNGTSLPYASKDGKKCQATSAPILMVAFAFLCAILLF